MNDQGYLLENGINSIEINAMTYWRRWIKKIDNNINVRLSVIMD
jgi:hypothetical protein